MSAVALGEDVSVCSAITPASMTASEQKEPFARAKLASSSAGKIRTV